jgi:hypothetical protein
MTLHRYLPEVGCGYDPIGVPSQKFWCFTARKTTQANDSPIPETRCFKGGIEKSGQLSVSQHGQPVFDPTADLPVPA